MYSESEEVLMGSVSGFLLASPCRTDRFKTQPERSAASMHNEMVLIARPCTSTSSVSYELLSSKCWKKIPNDGNHCRPEDHNEDSGKDKEHHWNHHLDCQFRGLLFGDLSSLRSQ